MTHNTRTAAGGTGLGVADRLAARAGSRVDWDHSGIWPPVARGVALAAAVPDEAVGPLREPFATAPGGDARLTDAVRRAPGGLAPDVADRARRTAASGRRDV